jgi:hypothetical protein
MADERPARVASAEDMPARLADSVGGEDPGELLRRPVPAQDRALRIDDQERIPRPDRGFHALDRHAALEWRRRRRP